MAKGGDAMDFAKQVFLIFSILAVAWLVGTVMQAEGKDKLKQACHPIEFVMDGLRDVTEGLTGYSPRWTAQLKRYLQGGCYYFFSIILFKNNLGEGDEEVGGVRTE